MTRGAEVTLYSCFAFMMEGKDHRPKGGSPDLRERNSPKVGWAGAPGLGPETTENLEPLTSGEEDAKVLEDRVSTFQKGEWFPETADQGACWRPSL